MSDTEDFIKYVLSLVAKSVPDFSAQQAQQFEAQIRQDWGGERPFIAKRGPLLKRARENVLAQVGTKPDAEVARENGISRRTMYRYLSKTGGK
jgi:DNA-binding phage protein